MLNTARLADRWREANGDPVRMASALGEELAQEDNRLVTKADLRAEVWRLKFFVLATILSTAAVQLAAISLMLRFL